MLHRNYGFDVVTRKQAVDARVHELDHVIAFRESHFVNVLVNFPKAGPSSGNVIVIVDYEGFSREIPGC